MKSNALGFVIALCALLAIAAQVSAVILDPLDGACTRKKRADGSYYCLDSGACSGTVGRFCELQPGNICRCGFIP